MSSTTLSQISCFSLINRDLNLNLRKRSILVAPFHSKFSVCMQLEGSGTEAPTSETKTTLRYVADSTKSQVEGTVKSYPSTEEEPLDGNLGTDAMEDEQGVTPPKKAAKIHDFCLGIPFGGLVLIGGIVGFLFSRNPTTLGISVLYGGGLLALSTFSLKVWRQGKSSLPFMLGQAGFYAVISAAMLCFYSYVMLSGGNPPPKKKLATNTPS